MQITLVRNTGTLIALLLTASGAVAQQFPTKIVRIIVPFSPGSILDVVARFAAGKSGEAWGQAVVVENRGGAGGRIGAEQVAKSAPDGHTLLVGSSGTHVASVYLSKNLPYDPVKDFTPITLAVEPVSALIINPSLPANNARELVEYLKRNPGKFSYASNGVGSVFHLAGELFKQAAGVDLTHLPLKGAGEVLNAVVGDHIPVGFGSMASLPPQIAAGKVRVLGMMSVNRHARFPDIPTLTEGVPAFEAPGSWLGFFGPANLPPAVLTRINTEFVKALNSPDVRPKLEEGGMIVVANTPQQFAEAIKKGFETYGRAVKIAGIKPE
ncbi:MAG: tripartite tricarboxylate transporter substrate binding protein [Betaproteobacteria bacterium]|nr:tripartite tricarboxylate transporter substrate binding protein [Betaproteobacteria bacterium]